MGTAARFESEPNVSNHFAWLRTRIALDRTFMAYMRTAVSLIGFGFTITQFFQHLRGMEGPRPMALHAPRDLGLALIGAGVVGLAVAALQYRAQVGYLWKAPYRSIAGFTESPHRTPVFIGAIVLLVIGIAAFVAVFFRMT